jgi:N-acetylglucosaminyldiphosphoundecaprenol N-acetyl-beta-D-mannosaminyltransferase
MATGVATGVSDHGEPLQMDQVRRPNTGLGQALLPKQRTHYAANLDSQSVRHGLAQRILLIAAKMGSSRPKNQVFGIRLSTLTKNEIVDQLLEGPCVGMGVRLLATANVDHVVMLRKDHAFRTSYERAWLVTADGAPVYGYARLLGIPVSERVTGADLINSLAEKLSPERHRLFFVTCTPRAANLVGVRFVTKGFQPDQIACAVPPRGFERSPLESNALTELVKRHRPTHLIIGISALRGQTWLSRCDESLGDVYALSTGAAIEYYLGLKRRAPQQLRRFGLEWLWRLLMEPRRLARRYLLESWSFVPAVVADLVTRGERGRL